MESYGCRRNNPIGSQGANGLLLPPLAARRYKIDTKQANLFVAAVVMRLVELHRG